MRPLAKLDVNELSSLVGVVFDLDDTFLDHGRITEVGLSALVRLQKAGLRTVACTGRPGSWAELMLRVLDLDAAIAENGAVAFVADREKTPARTIRLARDGADAQELRRNRMRRLADELIEGTTARFADDNHGRLSDVTIDIGEFVQVPAEKVSALVDAARARGARTFTSSVHLHLTLEPEDKASGALRLLVQRFGEDATAARFRYAYLGDSDNDRAAFAAFAHSFGVANVSTVARRMSQPPSYVATFERSAGFAEIVEAILRGVAPA